MTTSKRYITTLLLTGIYLLITLSPLAPLAMKSAHIAHAITGECTGDCEIDGCSPERRVTHTCCCWRKKLAANKYKKHCHLSDCCKNRAASTQTTITSTCPCGSGKYSTLAGVAFSEQLPHQHSGFDFKPFEDGQLPHTSPCMISRHADPPDIPPKIPFLVSHTCLIAAAEV